MTGLDKEILAERVAIVERHLDRVKKCLPKHVADFIPSTDASDAVILHLWQAIQIVIDTALAACVHLRLGTPATYAEAFLKLGEEGYLDKDLAIRLSQATGFRNRIVHAYEKLDMQIIYNIAKERPVDLIQFLAAIQKSLENQLRK